jgi:hypothetical protein
MISTSNPTKTANAARITGGQNVGVKIPAMRHTGRSDTTPPGTSTPTTDPT